MLLSVVAATGVTGETPNLLEITGMEELKQETKSVAVQNPEYQDTRNVYLTPQTHKKMSHTSKEIKRPSKKASMAWKMCVLNISNSVIWDQIEKEDVNELTSGIAGKYENQPHV